MSSASTNCFTLLELPELFTIDEALLQCNYFSAQRAWHPDRFVNAAAAEKQQAMQRSVAINDAYHTLKSPLKRAQHLLKLRGILVGSEQDTVKPSHALLMQVMESREALMDANSAESLAALAHKTAQEQQEILENLAVSFTGEDYGKAAELTLALSYLLKLNDEICQKQLTRANRA